MLCDSNGSISCAQPFRQVNVHVGYAGPFANMPVNFLGSAVYSCPEISRIVAGRAPRSDHISALAQDIWGLGCLFFWLLTAADCFPPCEHKSAWTAVSQQHDIWVSLATKSPFANPRLFEAQAYSFCGCIMLQI